ncbi:MAG: hypothetical protein WAO83_13485 [Fuerstiella sp.]
MTVTLTNVAQEFPAARWSVENPGYQRGCVVTWSLDAFALDSAPNLLADADVSVTLIKSGNSSRWTTTTPYASTKISNGKRTAVVSVASSRRGDAVAELRGRFLQPQISTLAAGQYRTTLTGTITGH